MDKKKHRQVLESEVAAVLGFEIGESSTLNGMGRGPVVAFEGIYFVAACGKGSLPRLELVFKQFSVCECRYF